MDNLILDFIVQNGQFLYYLHEQGWAKNIVLPICIWYNKYLFAIVAKEQDTQIDLTYVPLVRDL